MWFLEIRNGINVVFGNPKWESKKGPGEPWHPLGMETTVNDSWAQILIIQLVNITDYNAS